MDKIEIVTADKLEENLDRLAALFPSAITEVAKEVEGKMVAKRVINIEKLRELVGEVTDGSDEIFQFTWAGKRAAERLATMPTSKTLRPCVEESVGKDGTLGGFDSQNLYIEGDNLEVLKLLEQAYTGQIKMIYIDPPYNTGNDFVYSDKFSVSTEEWKAQSNEFDEDGNRLYKNTGGDGKYHTNWLNMMYPRLGVAQKLLKDEGVIFISIDDHEQANLKKLCDEVFGEDNFVGNIIRKTKTMADDIKTGLNIQHEYLFCYAKNKEAIALVGDEKTFNNYSNPDNDSNGEWCSGDPSAKSGGQSTYFEIVNPITGKVDVPPKGRYWAFSKDSLQKYIERGKVKFKESHKDSERGFIFKRYKNEAKNINNPLHSLFGVDNDYMNSIATKETRKLFPEIDFDYPKPVVFIKELINSSVNIEDIILDFFSGSATTAHAVMQLNAEDDGNRKFIMVQLPEDTDEKSEAYKAGYKNICEIGKERIRRAGAKIKEENQLLAPNIDTGFRVLKLDNGNLRDVHKRPGEYTIESLLDSIDKVESGRTGMDLLFTTMLYTKVSLDSIIETQKIEDKEVFVVRDCNLPEQIYLACCFEEGMSENVVKQMAMLKPNKIIFSDKSFASDDVKISMQQIIKTYSPSTRAAVLESM